MLVYVGWYLGNDYEQIDFVVLEIWLFVNQGDYMFVGIVDFIGCVVIDVGGQQWSQYEW